MIKYIDTHSHLFEKKFNEDREEVLKRMAENEVGTFAVGVSLETSKQAVALEESHENILGAVIGVHPTDTNESFNAKEYESILNDKVVGIGECGLDYYRTPQDDVYIRQREVFEAQVVFAAENDLPLMLHVRPTEGTTDAHKDVLEILSLHQGASGDSVRGCSHFFTSTKEIAREYLELGFYISFPGVVTFASELEEVVRDVPLDMMLVETDSPYAAPVPHRGKRNEPVFVIDTIRAIADIRGEDFEKVSEQLYKNTQTLFLAGK
ncbi:TatD family hydrolase [Candidatus Kaiserbacteria bacterium]|nr:MAG: TatD family hydrolase [Candidatus Kaiserbacteria bacterium]